MEAVDLTFSVDVAAVSKLMGMEGLVRAGVTVKELQPCDLDSVSVLVSPLTEPCSSSLSDKEARKVVSASESEPSKLGGQLLSYHGEESSRHLHGRGKNGFLLNTGAENVQLERKPGKVSKMGSLSSKRPRVARLEDPMSLMGVDGVKDTSDKLGSYVTKCSSSDKTQSAKQKNNFASKRGDKRNLKLPTKTKYDSFSVKAGLASFSSVAGGNNFFGLHGLKSDNHDVTKLVDDVPLNELLDGTYKCPSLGKGKGKKPANVNDSFLHSVRKACSILQLPRSVQPQHIAEVDSNSDQIMSPWPSSTTSVVASGDKGEPFITDLSSCNKVQDFSSKPETSANPLDLPLCQPKHILEQLTLPSHKDLESLLLDATKPCSSSKNTADPCSGKQISRRAASLPPFPWSHTSNGHCRTSADAAKLSISRGTCQGRWLRIARNIVSSLGIATNYVTDLESLTYDQSLVPSSRINISGSENTVSPSTSFSQPQCLQDSMSHATCSKESCVPLESGGKVNHSGNCNDEHCPKLLAAAEILCDMATHSSRQNPDGIIRWPKKPSQKAMKARKLKSIEKPEEVYGTSIEVSGSDNLRRSMDRMLPPKKPKLSQIDDKKDFSNVSSVRKVPINWSTPRSSRSSPSKSIKESMVDIRHSTADADVAKRSYMMPPPSRVPERSSNKREKLRKLLTMDWNRGRDRLD